MRTAEIHRTTKETDIQVRLNLDGGGAHEIATGVGFLDHMLTHVAVHGLFDLAVTARGDLHIDSHHTIEDCALALGSALRQALGDKRGVGRYGAAAETPQGVAIVDITLPMDETIARAAIDLSGRAYFVFDGSFPRDRVGDIPTELVPHFFRSLADSLGAAIHVTVRGENSHHMIEGCFKAMGRALRQAIRVEGSELPSSKGML